MDLLKEIVYYDYGIDYIARFLIFLLFMESIPQKGELIALFLKTLDII